jgi:hypothetical protein
LKADYYQIQDEWLEDEENRKKWEAGTLSTKDRRILLTHWLGMAAERFRKRGLEVIVRSWERTGCGMTADGTGARPEVSGVANYSYDAPLPAVVDEQELRGLDEEEAQCDVDHEEPEVLFWCCFGVVLVLFCVFCVFLCF